MNPVCESIQQLIPQALLNDLPAPVKARLDSHLAECPGCKKEFDLCSRTIERLTPELNRPVPRHFFVTDSGPESIWDVWRRWSLPRKGWALAVAVLLITVAGLVVAKTRVELSRGGIMVAFGQPNPLVSGPAYLQQADLARLRLDLSSWLEQKSASERQELIQLLKTELTQRKNTLSSAQEKWVLASLGKVEERLSRKILATGTLIEAQNQQAVARLSDSVARQRDQDLNLIDAGFRSLSRRDAMKNQQTDAILDTLIQVAELKMTPEASKSDGAEQK